MKFVIVLEDDPPVELLSELSKILSLVDKEARVHGLAEPTSIDLDRGDALVRVRMPISDPDRDLLLNMRTQ